MRILRSIATMAASAVVACVGAAAPGAANAATATDNPGFTANVMAPLVIDDWTAFDSQLAASKRMGVDAVSVDVWWGQVEASSDNAFDWSYYDKAFQHITDAGLKVVPILSFHQCGGNVGDACNTPLPSWLWSKYENRVVNGVTLGKDGLKYRSEQGNFSPEYVQVWADSVVQGEYADFTAAFADHFGPAYESKISEVNVSLGPAGELRFPSYNAHDSGAGYPSRGALQSYSALAVKDFQSAAIIKYGNLAGVNAAWGTGLTSTDQIRPPADANGFFSRGDYKNIPYGRDFVDWYNGSLVKHGTTVLNMVATALGGRFPAAALGYKVPGVHWSMTNPAYPRAAEVSAGLVQTSIDLNSDVSAHGYSKIIGVAQGVNTSRPVVLHFTCLEMGNEDTSPAYSRAQDLVFWMAAGAKAQGVAIKGENALAGGVTSDVGWDRIVNAFDWASYTGLTALRISDVSAGTGQRRYSGFIKRYRPSAPVTVHFAEYETAQAYSLHPWGGLAGDRPMNYEGFVNGRNWWSVTIASPPGTFNFCFTDSNGTWDGANREYSAQGQDLYVLPGQSQVLTARP